MPTGAEAYERLPKHLNDIVPFIAEGKSNQEIAAAASLALHTVENYVSEIISRTGCETRERLIVDSIKWLA
jgi:DNA-binding NarL/FixJ family response regulator